MVDGRVVGRSCGSRRLVLYSTLGVVVGTWLNWRPVGAIRGNGDSWLGRSGGRYVVSQHLQDCSPRLCQLRIVRLASASKY
jgi:hypothetical protein